MVSTSHRNIAPYDYERVTELRGKNKSWQFIGNLYGRSKQNAMRWYEREGNRIIQRRNEDDEINKRSPKTRVHDNGRNAKSKTSNDGRLHKSIYRFTSTLSNDEWLNHYCYYTWDKIYLTNMRTAVWTILKLLVLFPRGHGKTWSMIGLYCRYLLESGSNLLVFCSGSNKSDIHYAVLEILQSPRVIADYGDVIEKANELKGEIWLIPEYREGFIEPNFKIVGQLAKAIGKHPGWIVLEDVVQDIKASDEAEDRVKRWFDRVVRFMKKRGLENKTRLTIVGTRKDTNDFYAHIIGEHKFPVHHEKALSLKSGRFPLASDVETNHEQETVELIKTSRPIGMYTTLECPDWDVSSLLYDYIWKPLEFESEMQQNPLPRTGKIFDINDFLTLESLDHSELAKYAFVDPAYGKSTSADFFALLVCVVWAKKLVVIDGTIKQGLTFSQQIDEMRHFNSIYDISEILVEADFHQTWLAQEAAAMLYNVSGIKHRIQKEQRIDALDLPFRRHMIYFLDSFPGLGEMKKQFVMYDSKPSTSTKKDDGLDVLATAFQRLKRHIKSETLKVMTWS